MHVHILRYSPVQIILSLLSYLTILYPYDEILLSVQNVQNVQNVGESKRAAGKWGEGFLLDNSTTGHFYRAFKEILC